jgi:tetratricopeptide (TPR) repeat protein
LPAQAIFCYRRALEREPGQIRALFSLFQTYQAMRMIDARRSVATLMRRAWATATGGDSNAVGVADPDTTRLDSVSDEERLPAWEGPDGLSLAIAGLLRQGRAEAAARLFDMAEARGITAEWPARDRVATVLLYLGRPAEAGRVWERAPNAPSPALRLARIATAELAALDDPAAEKTYRAALKLDPSLCEAWFGLALLYTERGDPSEALTAAREGLRQNPTSVQSSFLLGVESLVARQ